MADWDTTRREFCRIAAKRGIVRIAREIPAHHATVYRLIGGKTKTPHAIMRARIEQIVKEHKANELPRD